MRFVFCGARFCRFFFRFRVILRIYRVINCNRLLESTCFRFRIVYLDFGASFVVHFEIGTRFKDHVRKGVMAQDRRARPQQQSYRSNLLENDENDAVINILGSKLVVRLRFGNPAIDESKTPISNRRFSRRALLNCSSLRRIRATGRNIAPESSASSRIWRKNPISYE